VLSLRYVDTDLPRPRWRATVSRRLMRTLQVGLEWNPVVSEVNPTATWFLLTETDTRPALFLGTSSARIGSPVHQQAYYATLARSFPEWRVSPYVSLEWSEWDQGWNVPFGATLDVGGGIGLRPMYDGHRSHLVASWTGARWSAGLVWAWYERPGVTLSTGF
jgi:hypothetical protein